MMKSQIGLGVLSIPSVFHSLGLAPGIIILIVIAILTTWTDYCAFVQSVMLAQDARLTKRILSRRHRYLQDEAPDCLCVSSRTLLCVACFTDIDIHIDSVADCGKLMFGRFGQELFGIGYWLLMTCIAGSAFLGISVALNAISLHATCTAVYVAVAAIVTFPFASLRTMGSVKWVGWVGLASMIVSIMLVTIAIPAGGRPSLAPQTGPLDLEIVIWGKPTFAEAMNAISNLVFSYAGTSALYVLSSTLPALVASGSAQHSELTSSRLAASPSPRRCATPVITPRLSLSARSVLFKQVDQ